MKKYLFIDTCIISEIIENESLKIQLNKITQDNSYCCIIGDKTLSELANSKSLFDKFFKLSNEISFEIAKSKQLLINEEIQNSKIEKNIDVSLIKLTGTKDEFEYFIKLYLKAISDEFPKGSKQEILDSILILKKNFPPKNGRSYLRNEIICFYETIVIQQLITFHNFNLELIKSKDFNIYRFKSLISQSLIVFWKFYKMKDRKSKESDVFDISMASVFPYVNAVITENNLARDLEMIKKEKIYFKNLDNIFTLKDLKNHG